MVSSEITKEKWEEAEKHLRDLGQRASKYSVVLMNESQPFGTCILLQHREKKYFLTAAHVALQIGKKGYEKIRIAIIQDEIFRNYPLYSSDCFLIKYWDPNFKEKDLQKNPVGLKDLAVIEIPQPLQCIIKAVKEFAKFPDDKNLNFDAPYVGFGMIKNNDRIEMFSFGLCLSDKQEREGRDCYIAKAMKKNFGSTMLNKPTISNFQGYSGGGLFLIKENSIKFVGIAYYQNQEFLALEDGYVEIHFYGPASLQLFVNTIITREEKNLSDIL